MPDLWQEVQQLVSRNVQRLLDDIDNSLQLADPSETATSSPSVGGNGAYASLRGLLTQEFRTIARDWQQTKRLELRDDIALLLIEAGEAMANSRSPSAPAKDTATRADSAASTATPPRAETAPAFPSPASPVPASDVCRRPDRPGVLKYRTLVQFLAANDFERVPHQTGEQTYKHGPTGAKIWIPAANWIELPTGTAHKILRGLSAILHTKLSMAGGEIVRMA